MISLNFNIRNPWSTKFENLWSKAVSTPFKFKFVELELYKDSSVVSVYINWTIRRSHAGLLIELGLLGYCCLFNFYDSRHWNQQENKWEVYTEG